MRDDLAVRAGRFERLGDGQGRQHAILRISVQHRGDRVQHRFRHERPGRVVDKHETGRVIESGKCFQPAKNGGLARRAAGDHADILVPTRNRELQEFLVVGMTHDDDRAIRVPAAKCIDRARDQGDAAKRAILLRAIPRTGGSFAAAGGHDHDAVALRRVHIGLYFVQVLPYGTAASKKNRISILL